MQLPALEAVAGVRRILLHVEIESEQEFVAHLSPTIIGSLFWSLRDAIDGTQVPAPIRKDFLDSTQLLVSYLIAQASASGELAEHVEVADGLLLQSERKSQCSAELAARLVYGYSVLLGLAERESYDHRLSVDAEGFAFKVRRQLWDEAVAAVFDADNVDEFVRSSAVVFIAEVLRNDFFQSEFILEAEAFVNRCLHAITESDTSRKEIQYLSYLVAAFSASGPSNATSDQVFSILTRPGPNFPSLIDDSLCALATSASDSSVKIGVNGLSSVGTSSDNLGFRLRVLRLLVRKVPTASDMFSHYSRQKFSLCLGAMGSSSENPQVVRHATELLEELTSNKEVLSVRERELGLILSQVSLLLRVHEDKTKTVEDDIFNSCFSIVSSILQRFSKQLQNCVPAVVSCLVLFLSHTLYGECDGIDSIGRGNKFGRLCEFLLPYGEAYKKHVLCLVVEFVNAMKKDLDPSRRNALYPAMYCLLDIMQQHETIQLNGMLDDMGRALLRTVHESYKKQHTYRGQ